MRTNRLMAAVAIVGLFVLATNVMALDQIIHRPKATMSIYDVPATIPPTGPPLFSNTCPATAAGAIADGGSIIGDTTGSTDDFVDNCQAGGDGGDGTSGQDEIFEFTVTVPGVWQFTTCTTAGWDTQLSIREETGGGCPGDFVACDGDGCGGPPWESDGSAFLSAGTTYYLIVDGFGADDAACSGGNCGPFEVVFNLLIPGCTDDPFCNDGLFCNGEETCDIASGQCLAGTDPCLTCDEVLDECVICTDDAFCDDGIFCNGVEFCNLEGLGQCSGSADPCLTFEGYASTCDEAGKSCPKPVNTAIWLANAEGQYFSPGPCDSGDATWVLDDIQGSHHTTGVLETYTTPVLARSTPVGASPLGTLFLVNQSLFTIEPGSCNPLARIADSGCTSPATVDPGGSPAHDLLCDPQNTVVLPNNAGDFSRCEVDFFIAFRTSELGAGLAIAGGTAELGGPAAADEFGVNVVWFEDCPPTGSFGPAAFGCPGCVSDFDNAQVHAVPGGACCHPDGSCSLTPEADCDGDFGATGTINGTDGGCGGDQDDDGLDNRCGDNCPDDANAGQEDCDGDGIGDACEEADQQDDDGDGVCNGIDNCPDDVNPGQENNDGDAEGNACDACPDSATGDTDGDGVCDNLDICAGHDDNLDADGDGVPDGCDQCPGSDDGIAGATGDDDGDGVLNCDDQCNGVDDAVFAPECSGKIPTVSEWGLVVLALLLLVAGKVYFGRRQTLA